MLHGGPAGSLAEIFDGFAPLTEHHIVIFYDQRGGGRSTLPADTTRLATAHQIADLDEVRHHFGLKTVHLIGHSYGALLAASYALAHPDAVASLVLLAGTGPPKGNLFDRMDSELEASPDEREGLGMSKDWWPEEGGFLIQPAVCSVHSV